MPHRHVTFLHWGPSAGTGPLAGKQDVPAKMRGEHLTSQFLLLDPSKFTYDDTKDSIEPKSTIFVFC